MGWSKIQVELLRARPTQCYKCWKPGHLKHACKSSVDRSNLCYRCGSDDHQVKWCNKEVHCVICKEEGYDPRHRMGSLACINNRNKAEFNSNKKKEEIKDKNMYEKKDNSEEMEISLNK